MTGTTLSHYKIVSELGRGGMGIVYLGEDTKLDRQVAIKVLPSSALASEDDRARFYREAKAAAALNHPNIAQIYQIDEAVPSDAPHGTQPSPFIAMEYIDGEPLDDRIKRGPLRLGEAIRLAMQMAGALGAAHEKDIVHRDVKASNVMLTSKGDAKVLDFGLALTAASTKLTRMGSTLGTVAYMSPEQARGEEVDSRTDLWALGVVLYEMVAGRNPFGGDYEQAVVYSILNADPEPLTAVRTGVPMEVEGIVSKLLRKDKETRYQTAADLIADLKAVDVSGVRSGSYSAVTTSTVHGTQAPPPAQSDRNFGLPAMTGIAGVTAVVALGLGWLLFSGSSGPGAGSATDIVRSTIILPEESTFSPFGQLGAERDELDVDPTGRNLVYSAFDGATNIIAMYSLADGTVDVLPETENGTNPVFSPDGRSIAYLAGDDVYILDLSGGRPRFVTSVSEPQGLSWLKDGHIYVADSQGQRLLRVAPDGTSEEIIPSSCNCAKPTDHPSGVGLVVSGRTSEDIVHVFSNAERDTLSIRGQHVHFLPSGFVTFLRTGSMFAARYDPNTGVIEGEGVLVLDDVRTGSIGGLGHYAISPNGTLAYVSGPPSGLLTPVMRMPDGSEERLSLPDGVYGEMDLSPDERRLIVYSFDRGRRLLMHDMVSGSTQTLPVPEDVIHVVWESPESYIHVQREPDSSTFYRTGLSGRSERLFSVDGRAVPSAVSRDGQLLLYRRFNIAGGNNILVYDLETDSSSGFIDDVDDPAVYWSPDFSPDSRYVVYTRSGAGRSEVFMQSYPPDGSVIPVSTAGGEEPFWIPGEDRIMYRYGADWYVVDVDRTGDDISLGAPEVLFTGPYANVAGLEYRVLTGGRTLQYRPVNIQMETSRIEIIAGFDRLLDELLPE